MPRLFLLTLLLLWFSATRASGAAIDSSVKDDKGVPIQEAVVYVIGAPPPPGKTPSSAIMDQHNKEFIPHVLPVEIGTSVNFPNRDNIRHHVYSFSEAKKFELPLYIGTPATPVVFDKPGPVVLGCNIHDWMVGYIIVLPTAYFGKTGTDGKARIQNVPSGGYEIRVWHPRMKTPTEKTGQRVTLGSGSDAAETAFVVPLKRDLRPPRKTYEQSGS